MNAFERTLLSEHLDQLRNFVTNNVDQDAWSAIQDAFPDLPGALYMLVQRSLLQTYALSAAQKRIEELSSQAQKSQAVAGATATKSGFASKLAWVPQSPASSTPPQAVPVAVSTQSIAPSGSLLSSAAETALGIAGGALLYDLAREFISARASEGRLPRDPVFTEETQIQPQDTGSSHINVFGRNAQSYVRTQKKDPEETNEPPDGDEIAFEESESDTEAVAESELEEFEETDSDPYLESDIGDL